ncbi:S-adenosyl-L-methionine-dependent methyltransferase [Gautieria morchelliformis]|nr:S-adenosyl-L-methionine-dependent methyltransferase [Gautieria morchelliformis]
MPSLLEKLSISLGPCQAAIEIRWMRQAARVPHDLQLMVNRRAHGEPIQFILGTQPFGPLNIFTRPPTLIPRPETEQWTTDLADKLQRRTVSRNERCMKVLDLCTGSGCIPLLLCHLLNIQGIETAALGVDVSQSACDLARDNIAATTFSLSSFEIQRKDIFDDDFWKSVAKAFRGPKLHRIVAEQDSLQLDVVTANPPYIPRDQWLQLPAEVKDWEDPAALLGDPLPHSADECTHVRNKGLTFYKRIRDLLSCPGVLSPQSVLALEVGHEQAEDVVKIFDRGFGRAEVWKDWWGKERAVFIFGKK